MPARRRMVVGAVETVLSTQVELYNSPLIGENACRWRCGGQLIADVRILGLSGERRLQQLESSRHLVLFGEDPTQGVSGYRGLRIEFVRRFGGLERPRIAFALVTAGEIVQR